MRKLFIILGGILGLIVAGGIFLYLQLIRPTTVDVPVAIGDIPPNTVLKSYMFRVSQMSNVDSQTVGKWVTMQQWAAMAEGKVTNSDIRSGFPVAKTQIDPKLTAEVETRLSLVLTQTKQYYVVIPVTPDEAGNFIQGGDRIDLIVSVPGADRKDALVLGPQTADGEAIDISTATEISQTAPVPFSKLIMQNMLVLRVERDKSRAAAAAQQNPTQSSSTPKVTTADTTVYDVKRLYVQVTRDQLEVLSFVLNNGRRNIAVRAPIDDTEAEPTDGVIWDDFVRWFYAQRQNQKDSSQPFNVISPSEPAAVPDNQASTTP